MEPGEVVRRVEVEVVCHLRSDSMLTSDCYVESHATPVYVDCFSGFGGGLFFASPGVSSRLFKKLVGLPLRRAAWSYLRAASRSDGQVPSGVSIPPRSLAFGWTGSTERLLSPKRLFRSVAKVLCHRLDF